MARVHFCPTIAALDVGIRAEGVIVMTSAEVVVGGGSIEDFGAI